MAVSAVHATHAATTAAAAKAVTPAPKPADTKPAAIAAKSTHSSTGAAHTTAPATADHAAHKTMNFGNDGLVPPARGDARFANGSTGPVVAKGSAPTLQIPDGKGFGGVSGRKQNADDRSKNNYSVTDANFNNKLGVLAKDPDTGEPMNYVKDIQSYNAAGYIETYAPDVYKKLEANQNAGHGTVLGAAMHIMGLVHTADAAEQGVDVSSVPMTIPGTNLDAREQVQNPKDGTGQNWARPHHAESHWHAFKSLIEQGVDVQHAQEFSGDDAVSGAGRLNGVNNQDGASGFNAGELEVWKDAAQYQQQTGVNVIGTMMMAHNMDSLDPSALTNPNINKQLGLDPNDRSSSAERQAAIYQGLLDGTVHNNTNTNHTHNTNNNGNADVNPACTTDGGGDNLGEVTGAGTGGIGTADDQDPIAALADMLTNGFADGVTGSSSMRLALLLQHLLQAILGGTAQVTPELMQQLMKTLGGLAEQLAASTDPAAQQLAAEIKSFTDGVTATGGTMDATTFAALLTLTNDLATQSGEIDPAFQAMLQQAAGTTAGGGAAATDPAALATTIGSARASANTAAAQSGAGVSLLQQGVPAAGTAAGDQAAAGVAAMPGMAATTPAAATPAATAPVATTQPTVTTAPAATTTHSS